MNMFANRSSKTLQQSVVFACLCLALPGNAIAEVPDDSASMSEHPWLSLHSAVLWSPALPSNLPMPMNTLSIGLMTGGMAVDVGVVASYSFGSLSFSVESNGSGSGVSSKRNDQCSVLLLAGSYTRSSYAEFGVHALAGYVFATNGVLRSIIGESGRVEQKIDAPGSRPALGYGVQALMFLRLDEDTAAGITVRYVRSELGGALSLGLGVNNDLL